MRRLTSVLSGLSCSALITASLVVPAVVTAAVVGAAPAALALDNGLARTPPMGFNNWNSTHCRADFNETMVKGIADIFVGKGLKDAGYQYVNIDDCWALPQRNAQGNLVPDPVRFPNGIKAVADYVHAKGLKFGLYTSAGTKTCDTLGFPGGIGHEQQDAALFASWGVDYLKYDNCGDHLGQSAQQRYTAMRDALASSGRPILFSICEWGANQPWNWAQSVGNSWRTTGDISDNWASMLDIMKRNRDLAPYARPGAWNDPDMLEVGNGGMTDTEYRTHFSTWAIMAAPLLIGTDLRTASQATFDILKNTDVIAVNQDPLGRQATVVKSDNGLTVLAKTLSNGDRAVALVNETSSAKTIATTVTEAGMGGASAYSLKDLWSKAVTSTTGAISASVPGHGTVMLRVTPSGLIPPPTGLSQLGDLPWTSASNGWGPAERNLSNGEQAAGDGRTLTIQNVPYAKGLGVHAGSEITYHLGGKCRAVTVAVGVDDEVGANGSVVFQIFRDGVKIADSGRMTGADAARRLNADVTGGTTLRLVVTDAGDDIRYDHADWTDARLSCGDGPPAGTTQLSDLPWSSAVNGWGPVERDRSNGEQAAGDGRTLTVGGVTFAKGLGVHAAGEIEYFLGGECSSVQAKVGLDDEVGTVGAVVFQLYLDGVKVADSGLMTVNDPARTLTANLTGGLGLRLVVTDGGNGVDYDHADWADPKITCT
ncbi:NPCBM/NEW2 domain-containing protein [Streptosporangium sp. CA-135522]|uniref:NPCBM/NEW2 domain-containing protein n=1 Tax=Streptosporangium sp. CA-135522 TaxID=3240072 RepID=UPI003D8F2B6B